MSTFSTNGTGISSAPIDPRKRVRYLQGMVLGPDDFIQESTYHSHHNQLLAREAIGYGTLSGLNVTLEDRGKGLEVRVSAGAALDRCGHLICVGRDQCAVINDWLRVNQADLTARGWTPGGNGSVWVVLSHRECLTDSAPVPGEPCRCDDAAMQESRILDDFRLELRAVTPEQDEEAASRDFFDWIRLIPISSTPPAATVEEFIDAVRTALIDPSSPPSSPPDFLYGSPPASLVLDRALLPEYWRAAFRLWVTELRPRWHLNCATDACGGDCGCGSGGTGAAAVPATAEKTGGVYLAELRLTLGLGTPLTLGSAAADQSARPIVMNLRMVQEWLLLAGMIA